jgi:hypothetical protein
MAADVSFGLSEGFFDMVRSSKGEIYSEQETARRRDAVIKLILRTPPKPHSEMKLGKPRGKPKLSPRKRGPVKKDTREG